MSTAHEAAVPQLHQRLKQERRRAEHFRALAALLAHALDAEIDGRYGRHPAERKLAAAVLDTARDVGLL